MLYTRIRFFLKKFDQFIKLCREYHQDICKYSACSKCDFITKLNIFYLENLITGKGSKNLQNLVEIITMFFLLLKTMLHSLAVDEIRR